MNITSSSIASIWCLQWLHTHHVCANDASTWTSLHFSVNHWKLSNAGNSNKTACTFKQSHGQPHHSQHSSTQTHAIKHTSATDNKTKQAEMNISTNVLPNRNWQACCIFVLHTFYFHSIGGSTALCCVKTSLPSYWNFDIRSKIRLNRCVLTRRTFVPNFIPIPFKTTQPQAFSWNDDMATILKVWRHIQNPTPSIDVHSLQEKSR